MLLKKFDVTSKVRKKVVYLLAVIIVLTAVLEIWAVNRLATFGNQISSFEKNKEALILENQLLENEIAQKNSLKDVSEVAKSLGFEKVKQLEYLEDHNLALNY